MKTRNTNNIGNVEYGKKQLRCCCSTPPSTVVSVLRIFWFYMSWLDINSPAKPAGFSFGIKKTGVLKYPKYLYSVLWYQMSLFMPFKVEFHGI